MALSGQISKTASIGGLMIQGVSTRTEEQAIPTETDLNAGKSGTLSTRTDNDTGVITMAAGHGFQTGDKLTVFSGTSTARCGMGATVAGDEVTVDGGAGDNLPAQSTAVIVCKEKDIDLDVVGNDIVMMAAKCTKRAVLQFCEADGTLIGTPVKLPENEVWDWESLTSIANPLADKTVGKLMAACADASGGTLQVGISRSAA